MAIRIVKINPAQDKDALNTEWFIVENSGSKPFSTKNCALGVSRGGQRPKAVGTLDPGFVVNPGAKYRVVTGRPGKKVHGEPPSDDVPNYHLFLGSPVFKGSGLVLTLTLRTAELARATFDPAAENGVASEGE
jgi:hypothetical protein